jgi:hypothetical protein
MTVRKTSVFLADACDVTFTAYVIDGENWNGWAVPYFPEDEADRVMAWVNSGVFNDSPEEAMRIARKGDAYEITETADPEGPYDIPPVTLTLDDGTQVTTWSIGGQSWTWEEAWYRRDESTGLLVDQRTSDDPDILLARIRGLLDSTARSGARYAELHDLFGRLDRWLTSGGRLPWAWNAGRADGEA